MKRSLSTTAPLETIDVSWGNKRALAEVRRTERRVLRIEVRPSGNVIVFAPFGERVGAIQDRVKERRPWIFRQIDRILSWPSPTPDRHFVSGETHLLLGRPYRLLILQSDQPQVCIEGSRLKVSAPCVDDQVHCRHLVMTFYAVTARSVFTGRLNEVARPFIRRGLRLPLLIVRKMSKRWGSYTSTGRIVLNVDLVRANPVLIDYVICHELAHAFHSDHGKEWRKLLKTVMPDWEDRKLRLEALLR